MATTTIDLAYQAVKTRPSDIYEHIETLYQYAKQCQHITECGVRAAVSSWAFLKGLQDNGAVVKRLVGVDIEYHPNIGHVEAAANQNGISFRFIHMNDVMAVLEPTDLLFIDTWHNYGHLKRELATHADKTKRFIILHDTTVDEHHGEDIRMRGIAQHIQPGHTLDDVVRIVRQTCPELVAVAEKAGYPLKEVACGLRPAVEEFLASHPEWRLRERFTNCNGLTVLERVQ
jgi:Methyltransferase domain